MPDNTGEPDVSASERSGKFGGQTRGGGGTLQLRLFLRTRPDGAYVCAMAAL